MMLFPKELPEQAGDIQDIRCYGIVKSTRRDKIIEMPAAGLLLVRNGLFVFLPLQP